MAKPLGKTFNSQQTLGFKIVPNRRTIDSGLNELTIFFLVIETPDGNLSKGMRQLNGVYTQTFNKRHGRVGHVFQGRFKAILVQKDSHFLEVCRYVALNPVRDDQPSAAVEME